MSSLTSPAFAATQYALLSSLYALPGKLIGGLSGVLAEKLGFPVFFILTSVIGVPVVILCLFIWRYSASSTSTADDIAAMGGETTVPASAGDG